MGWLQWIHLLEALALRQKSTHSRSHLMPVLNHGSTDQFIVCLFCFYRNTLQLLQKCFLKRRSTQRQVASQLSRTEMVPGITRDTIKSRALPLLAPSSVTHQDTLGFYPSSSATCLLAPTALLFHSYTTAFLPSRPQANKKARQPEKMPIHIPTSKLSSLFLF